MMHQLLPLAVFIRPRRHFPPHTNAESGLRMTDSCDYWENQLSPLFFAFIFTILGTECVIGIIANGFIIAVNAAEWVRNKAVSTSGRILFSLSISRIALQIFTMLELTVSSIFPHFYNQVVVYDTLNISSIFLNYCSLWFAAWLSFFYFVKIANFSYPLFLKLKWRISRWMPWLLWLSVFISLGYSAFFMKDVFPMYCINTFFIHSSNSTEKYFTKTNMVNLVLLYNLGICLPLSVFILATTLLIASLGKHTLNMESNATGSRDPSMQAHMGAIKAISYFLTLYIFNAVAVFLYMSHIFDITSPWILLCKIIMAGYPAGHSVLLILDNPSLRRAWQRFQHRVHLYLKGQTL
ncbi:taste receptor type 2 member 39-like [Trichechus manatus latirostris]|uniref:Taste receptor type 2 n=1 Tax=Trichechus manatus latirostris TaxID=127582 RepID=A0A2Y9DWJ2_TRIMA|nr:taste receptor type 2 member 39-like [Trichechus manatus latirostris]